MMPQENIEIRPIGRPRDLPNDHWRLCPSGTAGPGGGQPFPGGKLFYGVVK